MVKRANYTVTKDFDYNLVLPLENIPVSYKKGDRLNLRVGGKMEKDLIKKECIEREVDSEQT